jgi:hypothetical protein
MRSSSASAVWALEFVRRFVASAPYGMVHRIDRSRAI